MQLIFDIIEDKFKDFVKNNIKIFESMEYNEIINITKKDKRYNHDLCSMAMLVEPYNISYFGKRTGVEGDFYIFLNYDMDKVYTYNTAE